MQTADDKYVSHEPAPDLKNAESESRSPCSREGLRNRCCMQRVILVSALVLSFAVFHRSTLGDQPVDDAVLHVMTPGGVEYGVWNRRKEEAAPVLVVLSGTIDETLGSRYFRQSGNELGQHGWISVSIDLPCHGKQVRKGEPSGLAGWSFRLAQNEDIIAEFNARLSQVLDHLIETRVADPDRIAICGTSRGGFLALHFAAHDRRVRCAAAFAPITDPRVVREFVANATHPFVVSASLENHAERLAHQPVWIVIGDQDERVSTDCAVALAARLRAIAEIKAVPAKVELHVMPEPRGHTTPTGSSGRAAAWIYRHMEGAEIPVSARVGENDE